MDHSGVGAGENVTAEDFWAGVNALIYGICHHRHVCYKFPDCSNSHNEVTDCTVSSQHFGVRTQYRERLRDPPFWIIRRRHQSPNTTLMRMSVWLCARLAVLCAALWDSRSRRRTASDQFGKVIIQNRPQMQPKYERSSASSSLSTRPPSS